MSEHGELQEGCHVFRSRDHMTDWLLSHGFGIDGEDLYDGARSWFVAPDGWEMIDPQWNYVDLALEDDRVSIYGVDGVDWPTIDHRGEG